MKTIRQSVTFKASPHDVYEALMDSKKHGRFTGSLARISRKEGGAIMAYDGYVSGENVGLGYLCARLDEDPTVICADETSVLR